MRISDWSSDVCSSDLEGKRRLRMSRYMVTTAAAALLALAATNAQADIRIATAGPMTGQYASFGEQMQQGAEADVRDINAAGRVLGQKLVHSVGAHHRDPQAAVPVPHKKPERPRRGHGGVRQGRI